MTEHGPYKARYLLVERFFTTRKSALAWARKWSKQGHPVWVTGPSWGDEKHTSYIREVK